MPPIVFSRLTLTAALLAVPLFGTAVSAAQDELLTTARSHFKALKPAPAGSIAQVELGRKLFFEPRLSASGAISCNSCHNLATYGSDNLPTSFGHKAQLGGRNAPSVFNASLHLAQFWDGRAKDLTEQAKGPILNPIEMALPSAAAAEERLASIPEYASLFQVAFPGQKAPLTYDNLARAIAAFEATLVTPSRFDAFLQGDVKSLSVSERKGLKLFVDRGCVACHSGVAVGGNTYHKFGLAKPYANAKDLGRYELTKKEADKFVFKVPSLRNISRTYPYFHDGAVWSLSSAVVIMGETQLGIQLSDQETKEIVSFLESLRGDISPKALQLPVLPPSGPKTAH